MIALALAVWQRPYLRYLGASAAALAVDTSLFLIAIAADVASPLAAATGYLAGVAVHWIVSSRFVFADGTADRGPERNRQKAMFLGSALVGLAITLLLMLLAERLAFDVRAAKLVAIVISFQTTYALRRWAIFA